MYIVVFLHICICIIYCVYSLYLVYIVWIPHNGLATFDLSRGHFLTNGFVGTNRFGVLQCRNLKATNVVFRGNLKVCEVENDPRMSIFNSNLLNFQSVNPMGGRTHRPTGGLHWVKLQVWRTCASAYLIFPYIISYMSQYTEIWDGICFRCLLVPQEAPKQLQVRILEIT